MRSFDEAIEEEEEVKTASVENRHVIPLPGNSIEGGYAYAEGIGTFKVEFEAPFDGKPTVILFPVGGYEIPWIGLELPIPVILDEVTEDYFIFKAPAMGGIYVPYISTGPGSEFWDIMAPWLYLGGGIGAVIFIYWLLTRE